jgi:hypothetical protein
VELANKYGCIVRIFTDDKKEGIISNRIYQSLSLLTNDIVCIIGSDNIFPDNDFLRRLVEPFEDDDIFASYPMHNTYKKNMHILTRYTALLGSPDPTLFYLGKSDKVPMYQNAYDKGEIIEEKKGYYKVKFTKDSLPVVGDNGFAIRTDIYKHSFHPYKVYYHTDKYMDLLKKGINTYGVTKNAIIHTTKQSIWAYVKRRIEVKKHCTDEPIGKRTYLVYDPHSRKDRKNLFLFIVYSLTLVQPFALSIRGYMSITDPAWFLHPFMCILMVFGYGWSEIRRYINALRKMI